jgi:hypothetical protein
MAERSAGEETGDADERAVPSGEASSRVGHTLVPPIEILWQVFDRGRSGPVPEKRSQIAEAEAEHRDRQPKQRG